MDRFTLETTNQATPEILQQLADMLNDINTKLSEAESFAKKHGLPFSCDFGYGDRAAYSLYSVRNADWYGFEYDPADIVKNEWDEDSLYCWYTSTMSCM